MIVNVMLHEMADELLSAADIKAICKSRGFSEREASSRALFENMFLSPTGLEAAMSELTPAEVAALHLLHLKKKPVDVTFFERLYGGTHTGSRLNGTFTQQFKPIYDEVKIRLTRRGVLIVATHRTTSPNFTKMELLRFQFPPDFAPYLPSLFQASIRKDKQGTAQSDAFREQLRQLARGKQSAHGVQLIGGSLMVGKQLFKAKHANAWRQDAWEAEILKQRIVKDTRYEYLPPSSLTTPMKFLLYAFSQLEPDEWILPDDLSTLLDVFYGSASHPKPEAVCQAGWETNCLARLQTDSITYYRLADAHDLPADEPLERYLLIEDQGVFVNLDAIPYEALEPLNQMATFKINDQRLKLIPSVPKLVDSFDMLHDHPLTRYLEKNNADFHAVYKRVKADWGKLIVHDNLLVARIRDLSLRVKLQKAFEATDETASRALVLLNDEYVAFPRGMLNEVERVVKKAGHVINSCYAASRTG
jgi:hypothetical protein